MRLLVVILGNIFTPKSNLLQRVHWMRNEVTLFFSYFLFVFYRFFENLSSHEYLRVSKKKKKNSFYKNVKLGHECENLLRNSISASISQFIFICHIFDLPNGRSISTPQYKKNACQIVFNTYRDIHIFSANSVINFCSAGRIILKWIKRNKLCMPISTVHPHSVTVSISPHEANTNADWAPHVRAINIILVYDQVRYKRPYVVCGWVYFNGHAPTIFNMIHCDGNANDLSPSFGKGLCIVLLSSCKLFIILSSELSLPSTSLSLLSSSFFLVYTYIKQLKMNGFSGGLKWFRAILW